jgi:hypothetical protein
MRGPAFFAYADNYLIEVKFGVIVDVEAFHAIRQAEVGAAKTMIERTEERFGLKPERLAADTAYGSAANLNWLVQREANRAAHSGHRQVQARGRHLLAGRLRLRQGAQHLHVPGGQRAHHSPAVAALTVAVGIPRGIWIVRERRKLSEPPPPLTGNIRSC